MMSFSFYTPSFFHSAYVSSCKGFQMLVATLNCVRNTLDESLSKEAMGLKDVSSGIPGRMMANSMAFDNVALSILDQMEVHPLGLSSSHWSDNRWCSFLMKKSTS